MTRRRFAIALVAVALLALTGGCLGYVTGGGEVTNETLNSDPPMSYDFETDRDAAFTLSADARYTAVYNVSSQESLRLYRETPYAGDQPLEFEAFRYRYADGEVITGSEFRARGGEVEQTPDEVYVRFTDEMDDGQLAISGRGSPRRFTSLAYVEGSYAVTLPPEFSTDVPVVGHVAPRDYTVETVDGRDRIVWESVTNSIVVQSYRETDLVIFAGILGVASIVAVVGTLRFKRQLDALREKRREMGLGVYEDDDDDGLL